MIENRRLYAAIGYEETRRGSEGVYEHVFMGRDLLVQRLIDLTDRGADDA
jgi:hypothetical protein